jgi:hypothetical protein
MVPLSSGMVISKVHDTETEARMKKAIIALTIMLAVGAATSATAGPITTLFNTGGVSGQPSDHWLVDGGTAYVTGPGFPLDAWLLNDATSQWISPQASYAGYGGDTPQATYVFSTLFQIPNGYDPATAVFKMRVAADNQVTNVRLNGADLGISWIGGIPETTDSFTGFSPYYTVTGLMLGENQLAFDVWNAGQVSRGNPDGLRVEFTESNMTPVPEPTSLVLLGTGLVGLVRAARRRMQK